MSSFLKKKIFGTDLERAERERDRENLRVVREQAIYRGRVAGAVKAGYREGYSREFQGGGQGPRVKRVVGGLQSAASFMFRDIGSGSDPFGFPSQRRSQKPKRKGQHITIVVRGQGQHRKRKKRRTSQSNFPYF